MGAQTVITHVADQGRPYLTLLDTGAGSLVEVDSREVTEFRAQGLNVTPLCGGDRWQRGCGFADGSPAPVVVVDGGRGYCAYHSPVDVPAPARGVSLGKPSDRPVAAESRAGQVFRSLREGIRANNLACLAIEFDLRAVGGFSAYR